MLKVPYYANFPALMSSYNNLCLQPVNAKMRKVHFPLLFGKLFSKCVLKKNTVL